MNDLTILGDSPAIISLSNTHKTILLNLDPQEIHADNFIFAPNDPPSEHKNIFTTPVIIVIPFAAAAFSGGMYYFWPYIKNYLPCQKSNIVAPADEDEVDLEAGPRDAPNPPGPGDSAVAPFSFYTFFSQGKTLDIGGPFPSLEDSLRQEADRLLALHLQANQDSEDDFEMSPYNSESDFSVRQAPAFTHNYEEEEEEGLTYEEMLSIFGSIDSEIREATPVENQFYGENSEDEGY